MTYGYTGRILRVNLSNEKITCEEPSSNFYRMYLGGRTLSLYYLLKELKPGIDPLSEDNKIVFAPSVVTGAPIAGTSRYTVAAKSPQTCTYGEAEAGGFWGPELKFAGFDAVIVEGKSHKPVYLWIREGECEIRDAKNISGKTTGEAESLIRKELKDNQIRVAQTGPAGENLVKFACVLNELKFANGRSGMGCVMGSKRLRALAVRGKKRRVQFWDEEKIRYLARFFVENLAKNADCSTRQKYGTSGYFGLANEAGTLPTRNFHKGTLTKAEEVSGETMHEKGIVTGSEGCYACANRCKRITAIEGPLKVDPAYGGPEFESMAAFSSNLEISDMNVMVKANELCNKYGLDTISTGAAIAFAMECYENKIINAKTTDGIELKFGNSNCVIPMIELIVSRKGFGNILAEGTKIAAEKIGKNAAKFAMHVKGKELPMHEPRGKFGLALAYAVSPTGADHLQHEHDGAFDPNLVGYSHKADVPHLFIDRAKPLGVYEPVPSLDLGPKKVKLFKHLQMWYSLLNSLSICLFTYAPVRVFGVNQLPELVNACTGWDTSLWELMMIGEKGVTMARAFNVREGFNRKDDVLPERFFNPLEAGGFKGSKISKTEFQEALTMYYEMMGWDSNTGIPTKGKLEELGLGWI